MSFAEYSVKPLSLYALNFHEVVSSTSTFNMERYHTFAVLALNTSTFFNTTNDTLKTKSFVIDFIQTHWCFRGNSWAGNPDWAAEMHPFVERFSGWNLSRLKYAFVTLKEKHIILRCFCKQFTFKEVKIRCFLQELISWLSLLNN
jgi:hypothetical protein